MNLNCVGFYLVKASSTNFKKESLKNQWINANISVNVELDRYTLEIKPVSEADDVYDEDEDFQGSKTVKIRLNDFKSCEPRGLQKVKVHTTHVLVLNPKLFSKSKKVFLAFYNEESKLLWHKNLEIILTHKFSNNISAIVSDPSSSSSIEQFMIENDLYEGNEVSEFGAVVIVNEKSKEIGIHGDYILTVTDTRLELYQESVSDIVKCWEIKNIRKFGEKDNVFFMELGNHCKEGSGCLSFKMTNGKAFLKLLIKCKDTCLRNQDNKSLGSKKTDVPQDKETKTKENVRESVAMDMRENMIYSSQSRILSLFAKRNTSFEPPRAAPPPIPPTTPELIRD